MIVAGLMIARAEGSGPALSLLLAMTGRPAGLDGLSGDGAAELGQRVTTRAGQSQPLLDFGTLGC